MSNNDLSRAIDTSDEWIRTRTGIGSRYLMRSGESLVDIAHFQKVFIAANYSRRRNACGY